MELRGGSRDGAVNRIFDHDSPPILDEIPMMDEIPIIEIHSATASVASPVSTRTIPPRLPLSPRSPSPPNTSPSPPSTPGHRRGKSESQKLLPPTSRNLFQYSTTREFRYDQPEDEAGEGRESPNWKGVAGSLNRTRQQNWRDLFVDVLAIAAGLPFFALAGAIIRLDGKPVKGNQENILNQCIKGVSTGGLSSAPFETY